MQRRWMIPALFLATALVCAQTAPPKASAPDAKRPTAKKSAKRVTKKKPTAEVKVEPPPVPQPPPPPPTLAQQAPVAPRVSYRDGLLSIDAPNSTLADIFAAIKRATGATVDGPANLNDRVVVHLGPAQPRDVIAALLNGSRFDYVVMGSPQQPNGLSRILLMARQGSVEPAVRTAVAPNPPAANRPPVANTSGDGEDDDSSDRDDGADNPPAQPAVAQPEPNQIQPNMPPEQAPPPQEQNPSANPQQPNPQQPKTPEQLYKELQNLERQRQQNPPPQPPPQ